MPVCQPLSSPVTFTMLNSTTLQPYTPRPCETVTFTFSDGTTVAANSSSTQHTFSTAGAYSPSVQLKSSDGWSTGTSVNEMIAANGIIVGPHAITAREDAGVAHVELDSTFAPTSVHYQTFGGDGYITPVSGTLSFAAGETKKFIDVPLVNDSTYSCDPVSFDVRLSNPTNNALLYHAWNILVERVAVTDDETPPTFSWSSSQFTAEEGKQAVMVIRRTGDMHTPLSVYYTVFDEHGQIVWSNAVQFVAGQTEALAKVFSPDDNVFTGTKTWKATLTSTYCAAIGGDGTTTLLITDNEQQPMTMFMPSMLTMLPETTGAVNVQITPAPAAATSLPVVSSNPAVASVPSSVAIDATGHGLIIVSSHAAGSATITAGSSTFDVNVTATRPRITNISPSSGPKSGGTPVTITGQNLDGTCMVSFGGSAAQLTAVAGTTTIFAVTPPHAVGAVDVTLTCASASDVRSGGFTYLEQKPSRSRGVRH